MFASGSLPGPNRACRLLAVYFVTPRPLFSFYGAIYLTWYTSHLPEQNLAESDFGNFRYTSHVTTMFTYGTNTCQLRHAR